MSNKLYSGKWVGYYTYGETYPEGLRNTSAKFIINMTVKDGVLKGTCEDEQCKHLFVAPAIIEGTISGNKISFVKKYPHYWDIDDLLKIRKVADLPSQELHYSGEFDNNSFSGVWQMTAILADEKGDIYEAIYSGSWNMKKSKW
jgi:hypothetical protein